MITTHILDTSEGRPAEGIEVCLFYHCQESDWFMVGKAVTDADGRIKEFADKNSYKLGTYKIVFAIEEYLTELGKESFFPEAHVVFRVNDIQQHYHVPLLLSPFGYSTYRGS